MKHVAMAHQPPFGCTIEGPQKALKKILIADDDENDVLLFEAALEMARLPWQVSKCSCGGETIQRLQSCLAGGPPLLPDLLLLDLNMPGINGFDVLYWIRSQSQLDRLPVIVLSNSSRPQDKQRAESMCGNDYKVKPLGMAEYCQLLTALHARWLA